MTKVTQLKVLELVFTPSVSGSKIHAHHHVTIFGGNIQDTW